MTGKQLDYNKHLRAEFGEYAQTHEEHDSDMYERTVGAICLGPTGNQQGGHYFMSLATGEHLIRSRWTPLPMPREAQTRVNNFGRKPKMPKSLTLGDHHGQEIPDNLDEAGEWSDDEDDTYEFHDDLDIDELSYDDTADEVEDAGTDISQDDSSLNEMIPEDGPSVNVNGHGDAPSLETSTPGEEDNIENTGVEDNAPMNDNITSAEMVDDDQDMGGLTTGVGQDPDMVSETTGVEHSMNEDTDNISSPDYDSTEEDEYEKVEQLGVESANEDVPLPKRVRKKKADEIYEIFNSLFTGINAGHVFATYDEEHTNRCLSIVGFTESCSL